jgi:hypothetical protein
VGRKPQFHCDVRASFATAFSNWRRKSKIPLKKIAKDLGEYFPTGHNFELLVEYTGLPPCKLFCVMADKCVPADCLLAMRRIKRRPARARLLANNAGCVTSIPFLSRRSSPDVLYRLRCV